MAYVPIQSPTRTELRDAMSKLRREFAATVVATNNAGTPGYPFAQATARHFADQVAKDIDTATHLLATGQEVECWRFLQARKSNA